MAKITILGCGFGTALAIMWDKYGHNVTAWSKYQEEIDAIMNDGEHKRLLPGVIVPPTIRLTTDINCVSDCDILVFAIPSKFVREVAQKVKSYVKKDTIVVNVGKGFEENTDKRLSQVLKEELPDNRIAVLTGPSHAEEIGRNVPTTIVVSSEDEDCMMYLQETLQNDRFRIYRNSDLVGCELGGALKNPIALCCGIVEGMGLGDNTIAALMTRGLAEITRLGVAMGGKRETFDGLSGVGDLIVTCTSMHSRNRRAGYLMGQGYTMQQAMDEVQMVVEGVYSAKAAKALAEKYDVEMPIIMEVNKLLFENKPASEAVKDLMQREKQGEISWE